MRQAGVYTEGNMLPACRGAGSQSPWSDAGRSQKLHPTNRRPTWRATVPYRARCLRQYPIEQDFRGRDAHGCVQHPDATAHSWCELKALKTVPYRFNTARARAGAGSQNQRIQNTGGGQEQRRRGAERKDLITT
jgi:hypothetical protein